MKNKKSSINETSLKKMFFEDRDEFGRTLYKDKFDEVEYDSYDQEYRGDYADASAEFDMEKEQSIIAKMREHMLHHAVHGTKPEDWDTLDLVDDIFNDLTESEIDFIEDNEEKLNELKNSAIHEANKELISKMQKESLVKEEDGNVDKEDNTPFTETKKNYHHSDDYYEPGVITYDEKEDTWYDPSDSDNNQNRLTETAPPGKKYEDMVLAMKAKGTPKNVAYATAWKRYNEEHPGKKNESIELTEAYQSIENLLGVKDKKEKEVDPKIKPWKNTVDAMTEFGDINNPHAMAWSIFNKHNKGQKALIKQVIKIARKDNKDR